MSNIEWTDQTWNPVVGCTPVSPGCLNCYAATMAVRLEGMAKKKLKAANGQGSKLAAYAPRVVDPNGKEHRGAIPDAVRERSKTVRIAEVRGGRAVFTGDVRLVPERLADPLKWSKPRMVFVDSMSDLFHESVPDQFIRLVFAAMSWAGHHTFQVLTKRPERMAAWFADEENDLSSCQAEWVVNGPDDKTPTGRHRIGRRGTTGSINGAPHALGEGNKWPLPNVWLGTSVENQAAADERIPHLLKCPARVRFLSCEPLLEAIDLADLVRRVGKGEHHYSALECDVDAADDDWNGATVNWVIVGGESGRGARPCDVGWIRSIVEQCKASGVPCFVKQLGKHPLDFGALVWPGGVRPGGGHPMLKNKKGGDPAEWPEDLRVRQMPARAAEKTRA